MKITLIILGFLVLILIIGVVIGCSMGIKTLKERCTYLERSNQKNKNDIYDLCIEIDQLKISANARKELELMAERKEKMSDYIAGHRYESNIDLAGHLYEIAKGRCKED